MDRRTRYIFLQEMLFGLILEYARTQYSGRKPPPSRTWIYKQYQTIWQLWTSLFLVFLSYSFRFFAYLTNRIIICRLKIKLPLNSTWEFLWSGGIQRGPSPSRSAEGTEWWPPCSEHSPSPQTSRIRNQGHLLEVSNPLTLELARWLTVFPWSALYLFLRVFSQSRIRTQMPGSKRLLGEPEFAVRS